MTLFVLCFLVRKPLAFELGHIKAMRTNRRQISEFTGCPPDSISGLLSISFLVLMLPSKHGQTNQVGLSRCLPDAGHNTKIDKIRWKDFELDINQALLSLFLSKAITRKLNMFRNHKSRSNALTKNIFICLCLCFNSETQTCRKLGKGRKNQLICFNSSKRFSVVWNYSESGA